MDYINEMDKIIRKNCLKYSGLNISAEEFFPSKQMTFIQTKSQLFNFSLFDENAYENACEENACENVIYDILFNRLERNFVNENSWLFE